MENYCPKLAGSLLNVTRRSVFANYCSSKLGYYFPDIHSSRGILVCRRFTSQRGKERIYNCKFSKVKAVKKEREMLVASSQVETCLQFSQAENIKVILVNGN